MEMVDKVKREKRITLLYEIKVVKNFIEKYPLQVKQMIDDYEKKQARLVVENNLAKKKISNTVYSLKPNFEERINVPNKNNIKRRSS